MFSKIRERIGSNQSHTIMASYIGYMTQALVNNIAPLLFLTFQRIYDISLEKITFLATFNFGMQLLVDFISAKFVHKIGYRRGVVIAHLSAAIGVCGLGVFPEIMEDSYLGLLIAIVFYAIGGGLIEVLVSPMIEALDTEKKAAAMSILHSFYCWGQMATILLSTLFFWAFGIENWRILVAIWAIMPLFNAIYYLFVPINTLEEKGGGVSLRKLFNEKIFYVLLVIMLCSGASELAMSQWASTFAEMGLNVSKSMGDILGPCMFAAFMGIARIVTAKLDGILSIEKILTGSSIICILSYLIAALVPNPYIALMGLGMCGFSVGAMWPGTLSLSMKYMKGAGTSMFAILALAGDVGCSVGPTLVGNVAGIFDDNLKIGLLFAIVFPAVLIIGTMFLKVRKSAKNQKE